MLAYNATYTSNGHAQPAVFSLLNDKAVIRFATPEGDRMVYWSYQEIVANQSKSSLFTYTAYPPQTLEILDRALAEALSFRLVKSKKRVVQTRNRTALFIVVALLAAFAAAYFFIVPWAATALASQVPPSYEKKLGAQMYAALKRDFTIDENRSVYTTAFFDALQIPSNYPIQITVVHGDIANAFALPGGHIIIYDGLLNQLTAYPQLAALLSHEFIHIEARHSLKTLFRQASATLLFSTLIGDAGAIGAAVLNSADNLKSLSYSRSLEREADAAGLALLTARNIDGAGFIQLFQILQKEPDTHQPEWVSSHPQLERRIQNIREDSRYQQQHARIDSTLRFLFLRLKTAD